MIFEQRKKEIFDNCLVSKNCTKQDQVNVLRSLQRNVATTVCNSIHVDAANLRIMDVFNNYLKPLNSECDNIAKNEMEELQILCKDLNNLISAEISGNAGEAKAFKSIETLSCEYRLCKNIEMQNGDHHTELDAIVVTRKAIFIIEVKNPKRDIRIDERGNYVRISDAEHYEGNIGEKMNEKTYLLRKALIDAGIDNINIESLLVFTNSSINVENKFEEIQHAYLSQLPHIIKKYKGDFRYNDSEMDKIVAVINKAKADNVHRVPFDIDRFVDVFSTTVAKLEMYKAEVNYEYSEDTNTERNEDKTKTEPLKPNWKKIAMSCVKKIAPFAASYAIVSLISIIEDKFINKQ